MVIDFDGLKGLIGKYFGGELLMEVGVFKGREQRPETVVHHWLIIGINKDSQIMITIDHN